MLASAPCTRRTNWNSTQTKRIKVVDTGLTPALRVDYERVDAIEMYTTLDGYKTHVANQIKFYAPALPGFLMNDTGMVNAEYGFVVRRKDDCGRCPAVRSCRSRASLSPASRYFPVFKLLDCL